MQQHNSKLPKSQRWNHKIIKLENALKHINLNESIVNTTHEKIIQRKLGMILLKQ
jgi:hypothetical protein